MTHRRRKKESAKKQADKIKKIKQQDFWPLPSWARKRNKPKKKR